MKINYTQLSIKAHYFFYMATIGAIFPFLPVYGKQLGVSPVVMGSINAILPFLSMITKPTFGFIMDYFHTHKKLIFMSLLVIASSSYILIYFLPSLPESIILDQFQNISCASLPFCDSNSSIAIYGRNTTCHWVCNNTNFSVRLSFYAIEKETIISPNITCLRNINELPLCQEETTQNYNCNVTCDNFENNHYLYTSLTFWGFVLLMFIGNISYSVCMSVTDALCLEILGKDEKTKYGRQRVWGGIGFGSAGFLTGYTVDLWSQGNIYKTYTPAFLLVFVFTCFDLICCRKMKLPRIQISTNVFTEVCALLKFKFIIIFLCFAIIVGILDGYVIYFLLWYEEDLAMKSGRMDKIKLIQGLTLASEAFGSVLIFMPLSGKILRKLGYGYTFALALVLYALRLELASLAPTPEWIVPIEFLLVGPSFALTHTTLVEFASAISSSGVSVSVQGIMSGMKDGCGIALGNLIGGNLLKNFGGVLTLQIFAILALFSAIMYFVLYITYLKHKIPGTRYNVEWRMPDDARRHCTVEE